MAAIERNRASCRNHPSGRSARERRRYSNSRSARGLLNRSYRRPKLRVMTSTLILLLLIAAIVPFWMASRDASERAVRLAGEACSRAGVQLLDHSVALHGLGLARGRDGWLRLRRRYQFEYSTIGHDRQRGSLALLGGELLWITEPERASSPS